MRSVALKSHPELLDDAGFGVTHAFCPEEALMGYIGKLVTYPEALQVREFAQGNAALASVRARGGAPVVGLSVSDVRQHLPEGAVRVVGVYRRFHHEADRMVPIAASTRIEPGDEVFVLSDKQHLGEVLAAFNRQVGEQEQPVRRVMVAGGGRVGMRLARFLTKESKRFQIKIIEKSEDRCVYLASRLSSDVLVLKGDATDETLMENENGAMRQTAPLAPAVHLGAKRIVVVGVGRAHEVVHLPQGEHAQLEHLALPLPQPRR